VHRRAQKGAKRNDRDNTRGKGALGKEGRKKWKIEREGEREREKGRKKRSKTDYITNRCRRLRRRRHRRRRRRRRRRAAWSRLNKGRFFSLGSLHRGSFPIDEPSGSFLGYLRCDSCASSAHEAVSHVAAAEP